MAVAIQPSIYFETLLENLRGSDEACALWNQDTRWTNPLWTSVMTGMLVQTTRQVLGAKMHVSAKGIPADKYRRHEYLTLDVMGYDDVGWKAPLVIVEHENSPHEDKIQYCAWKLLCVEADLRVLVAYVDSTGHYSWCFPSRDALLKAIERVKVDHPQRKLAVVAGDWCAVLRGRSWNDVFHLTTLE